MKTRRSTACAQPPEISKASVRKQLDEIIRLFCMTTLIHCSFIVQWQSLVASSFIRIQLFFSYHHPDCPFGCMARTRLDACVHAYPPFLAPPPPQILRPSGSALCGVSWSEWNSLRPFLLCCIVRVCFWCVCFARFPTRDKRARPRATPALCPCLGLAVIREPGATALVLSCAVN